MFKNPSFLFDIVCTVVWLLLAVRYARKGFLAASVQLGGNVFSLVGARVFSGWAAVEVFQRFLAGSFRTQIAESISAGGVVDLTGIADKYAGFLPESFRASIVEACERSISAVLSDNAVVLADVIVQKVLAPLLTPVISVAGPRQPAAGHRYRQPLAGLAHRLHRQHDGHLPCAVRGVGHHRHHGRQSDRPERHGHEQQPLL